MTYLEQGTQFPPSSPFISQDIAARSTGGQDRHSTIANFAVAPDTISRLSDASGAIPGSRGPQPSRRHLQDSCGADEPIEVISSLFPLLEGCHFVLDADSATTLIYLSVQQDSAVGVVPGTTSVRHTHIQSST